MNQISFCIFAIMKDACYIYKMKVMYINMLYTIYVYQKMRKTIEKIQEINFLGVTFNENLSWKTHMQKILGKSSYCVIKKIQPYLNNKHLHILYSAFRKSLCTFHCLLYF